MIALVFILSFIPMAIRLYVNRNQLFSIKEGFFSFCEDLFVGFEQILILYFAGSAFFIPVSLGIAILQIYYFLDGFLYSKMGIHIHLSHISFLKNPRPFFDSFLGGPFFIWLGGGFFVAVATFFISIQSVNFSLLVYLLPVASFVFACKYAGKNIHNPLLMIQMQVFCKVFFKKSRSFNSFPEKLLAQCETATKMDPEKYPLLKMTSGFTGDKQFEIKASDKPNIIFIFLESFRAANIGALRSKKGVTPHFDRLAKEGILFDQFYANGTITMDALWASLTGVLPIFGRSFQSELFKGVQKRSLSDIPLIAISEILRKAGYYNLFIEGGELGPENHGVFLKNNSFDEVIGRESIFEFRQKQCNTSWGIHDEHVFSWSAEKIEQKKGRPLFATIFTLSNHHPWKVPPNYNLDNFHEVENPLYRNFLQTMHYTDNCLHEFILDLEKRDILKDSILFILGDHGMGMGEHPYEATGTWSLYEQGIRIPLLIYAKDRIKVPKVISDIGSQVDLFPTVMDLLNLKGLNHSVGRTLVRKSANRFVFFQEPSYMGSSFGLRDGSFKYIANSINDSHARLFDLANDPDEKSCLKDEKKLKEYGDISKDIIESISSLCIEKRLAPNPLETVSFAAPEECNDELLKKAISSPFKITSLNLNNCIHVRDKGFKEAFKRVKSLESFQSQNCFISDASVKELVKNCRYLKSLNLANCPLISDVGFTEIARKLSKLSSINMSYNQEITGDFILQKKVEWEEAFFEGCHRITDKGLKNIVEIAPQLRKMRLSCKSFTSKNFAESMKYLVRLNELKLSNCEKLEGDFLLNLTSSIQHLALNHAATLTDSCLKQLKDKPLSSLELSHIPNVTDKGINWIADLPIKQLILNNSNLSDGIISGLKKLPLTALAISPCRFFSEKGLLEILDLDIGVLILKGCNARFKSSLEELYNKKRETKEIYITFQ
jgi:arylsulfatase A-like enzyme